MAEQTPRNQVGAPSAQAAPPVVSGEVPGLLFTSVSAGVGPSPGQALVERLVGAALIHALALLVVFAVFRYTPPGHMASSPMESIPFHEIVWLNKPGPGGGGGGGGNRMPFPSRRANAPVPVARARPTPVPVPSAKPAEMPPPALDLPARPNDVPMVLPGATDVAGDPLARGPGSGGGFGTGTGTGIGPGNGPGLGPGWGGGTGGGAYRPGSGVTSPILIREVKPQYTAEAMRAKIQGSVLIECVVQPDGTVSDLKIIKSLDPIYGLDQEALKAARQWRFRPGMRQGQPVPVLINIQLDFNLR
jgi:TonB family protein